MNVLREWIRRDPPAVLSFADWYALQLVRGDLCIYLWLFGVALSACDRCLDQADTATPADRRGWTLLAAAIGFEKSPDAARFLTHTLPQITMPDEQAAYLKLIAIRDPMRLPDLGPYFVFAAEARGDWAGAWRLRTLLEFAGHTGVVGFSAEPLPPPNEGDGSQGQAPSDATAGTR